MSAPSDIHPGAPIAGTYFDGRVARTRAAIVAIEGGSLVIRAEGEVARWPLDAVRLVGRADDGPVRQLCHGEERLAIHKAEDFASIAAVCPHLASSGRERRAHAREAALWIGGSFAAIAILILVVIPLFASSVAVLVPRAAERRLGNVVRQQVFAQLGDRTCEGDGAIRALKARLASLHPAGEAVEVLVLDTPLVNAFTLPGGVIIVMRGLIDVVEAPEEVAGVLAHELAHHVHRHPLKLFLKAATTSVLIGVVIGDVTGGTVIAAAGSFLAAAAYTREYEREADADALAWLSAAKLDPGGMVRFFGRLKEREGDWGEGALRYLSTHPPLSERMAGGGEGVADAVPAFSSEEWRAIKAVCH